MRPFLVCPHCKDTLVQNHTSKYWWEEHCCRVVNSVNRCPIEYRQYYKESYSDDELQYIHFRTKDFNIYCYYDRHINCGKTYVYHVKFPRGESTQKPFVIVKNFPINFDDVEPINQRFKKLVPFE